MSEVKISKCVNKQTRRAMRRILAFRVWNPNTWTSLSNLLASSTILLILYLILPPELSQSSSFQLLLSSLLVASLAKTRNELRKRYEAFQVFERGGIPSVGNKNPISGNLFEVIVPNHNLKVIHDYHQRLGKTFGCFYGPDPWVFTTDLDLLQKVFTDGKTIDMTQFRLPFITEINRSLSQVQGDEWRRLRRILDPSFAHRQMKSDNVFKDIDVACNKLLDCIESHPIEESDKQSRLVDVMYNFKKYSIEVIFRVAYGEDQGVNMTALAEDPLIESMDVGSKQIRGPFVWLSIMFDSTQWLLGYLARFTPIGKNIEFIHSVLDRSLSKRRLMSVDKRNRKMIDTIIESGKTNLLNEPTLKANLFFMFIAGFETTANTLTFLFWELARDERVQEKLRQALMTGGEEDEYLNWCIQETLRLHPAVPTAVGRILHEDVEFRGNKFFKGTTINASIYSIHHWPDYWGEDVESFRPERFSELSMHPAQYFAFGLGPRYCIGQNLALAELRAIVPRLLLKYRVQFCDSTPNPIAAISPNLIHMIIEGKVTLKFTQISNL